jgi:hypothetical protein
MACRGSYVEVSTFHYDRIQGFPPRQEITMATHLFTLRGCTVHLAQDVKDAISEIPGMECIRVGLSTVRERFAKVEMEVALEWNLLPDDREVVVNSAIAHLNVIAKEEIAKEEVASPEMLVAEC